jgi:type IV secretory pathway TraG/TraD family ATPase VirD4
MNQGDSTIRTAWFVLDELASLQRLPQLHTALTENRKSNNPVVIGFQGRSQLETRYGHEAEAMLSQPATKIFLHTSEPRAAKWISDTIGEVEVERRKQSLSREQFPHLRGSSTHYTETRTEPLMLPSEISGLSRLHAVAKVDNFVVRFSFPYIPALRIQPGFIPRESIPQSKADIVDISKTPRQSDTPTAQELKPAKAKKIAAGLEPFFDE